MKILEELAPEFDRQLKHTWVKGRDEKGYKILTLQLYDKQPPPEFPNWEVSVVEVDERGKIRTLVQPLLKRYFDKQVALDFHQTLLETFDEFLKIPEPKKEEHKKPALKESEAHPPGPAEAAGH
ncbi:MAG TPA: hypothetical protein VFC90_08005 [Planctomycetota bacterium]|nr:hypothetical protein [Planctomycetota bacterium]